MNTFIPYSNFTRCAQVLDGKRLFKQCVECKQIVLALTDGSKWSNHPAVLMWKDNIGSLIHYAIIMCNEAIRRKYKANEMLLWFQQKQREFPSRRLPRWLGKPLLHQSHRANLIRKDRAHYEKYWKEEEQNGYLWPVRKVKGKMLEWQRIDATPIKKTKTKTKKKKGEDVGKNTG